MLLAAASPLIMMGMAEPLDEAGRRTRCPLPSQNGGPVLLEFKCPQARMPVHVEVPGHTEAVKSNWTREIRVRCPHCRAVHWFSYRTGYIEAAISQLNKTPVARDTTSP
jgi:hypothetical protein